MIPSGSSRGENSRNWARELESFGRCWVENIGRCLTRFGLSSALVGLQRLGLACSGVPRSSEEGPRLGGLFGLARRGGARSGLHRR